MAFTAALMLYGFGMPAMAENVTVDLSAMGDIGDEGVSQSSLLMPGPYMPRSTLHVHPTFAFGADPRDQVILIPPGGLGASNKVVLQKPGASRSRPAGPPPSLSISRAAPPPVAPPPAPAPAPKVAEAPPPAPAIEEVGGVEAPAPPLIAKAPAAERKAKPEPKPAPKKVAAAKPAPAPKPKPKAVEKPAPAPEPAAVAKAPAPKAEPAPPKPEKKEVAEAAPPKPKLEAIKSPPPPPPPAPDAPRPTVEPKPKSEPKKKVAEAPIPVKQQASLTPPAAPMGKMDAIRVEFAAEAVKLTGDGKARLKAMADQVKSKTGARLQLLSFAGGEKLSSSRARRLSLSRALAVRSFLIESGVRSTRIDVRALGNKTDEEPINRVDVKVIER